MEEDRIKVIDAFAVPIDNNTSYILEIGKDQARINMINNDGTIYNEFKTPHNRDLKDSVKYTTLEYDLVVGVQLK